MVESDKSCVKGLMFSFLAGACVGAITSLLLAPMSGKEMRETLGQKYEELKEKLKKLEDKLGKGEDID